jgi:hypothetical protein
MRLLKKSKDKAGVGPIPGRKVFASQKDAKYKVDIDIRTCIHGYLASNKEVSATLIVFDVQLVCTSNKGIFDYFNMEVEFQDKFASQKNSWYKFGWRKIESEKTEPSKIKSSAVVEPAIMTTAPFVAEEHDNKDVVDFKRENSKVNRKNINSGVGVGNQAARMGASGAVENTISTKEETTGKYLYFSKGSSNTRCDASGRRYAVWWNVKKSSNPNSKDDAGIHPNYRFAVLLKRNHETEPFEAQVQLTIKADSARRSQMFGPETAINRPALIKRLSEALLGDEVNSAKLIPVVFDPKIKREGKCDGIDGKMIDRKNLGKWADHERLAQLTLIRRP